MDKVKNYQQIIISLLNEYRDFISGSNSTLKNEFIIDTNNNHYQWIYFGWEKNKFSYAVNIHIDIVDGLVWIHQNNTEFDVAQELLEHGIPKSDIVLGFQSPSMREYSGFAVA